MRKPPRHATVDSSQEPKPDLSHIFEPFRRVGNVESFAGRGIGLADAKWIVELHGGTIAVRSSEGQGSTSGFASRSPQTLRCATSGSGGR
jgi:signal transduction histidine kinase